MTPAVGLSGRRWLVDPGVAVPEVATVSTPLSSGARWTTVPDGRCSHHRTPTARTAPRSRTRAVAPARTLRGADCHAVEADLGILVVEAERAAEVRALRIGEGDDLGAVDPYGDGVGDLADAP